MFENRAGAGVGQAEKGGQGSCNIKARWMMDRVRPIANHFVGGLTMGFTRVGAAS